MFAAVAFLALVQQAPDLDKFVLPVSKPIACPPVSIDVTDLPDAMPWAEKAKTLVEEWFPQITALLDTKDYRVPSEIKLVVKKKINVPAYTSNATITINGEWITQHPDDLGMVVHELVHVVQHYPGGKTNVGWLVEGIADYIRWWRYEPEYFATHGRPKIDPAKSKYSDAYRTTAYWLAYVGKKYDSRLVFDLDSAMRHRQDPLGVFKNLTGKEPQELWDEFIEQKP